MSLLTFFAEQRRYWFHQTKQWPAQYVDGGLSALLKAEVVFTRLPLYNGQFQLIKVQRELDDVTYKYAQFRKQHEQRITNHAAAVQQHKEQIKAYKQLEKRVGQARRTLKHIAEVAGREDFEPEVLLRYMQELMKQYFALVQAQAQEGEAAPSPAE